MKGYIRHSSGALIKTLTPEEEEMIKIKRLIKAIVSVLPASSIKKIDSSLLEVIDNV